MGVHVDFKEYLSEGKPGRLVVLHHWDTDGLTCAALFLNYLKENFPQTETMPMNPMINNYDLTELEIEKIINFKPDAILMADLNFAEEVIEKLEAITKPVFVFDHHAQTAESDRPGIQETDYPGCSAIVDEYLNGSIGLYGVLGMVGDVEERIKENAEYFPFVEKVMKDAGLEFEDLHRITRLIDGTYIIMKPGAIDYAITILQKDPKEALEDEQLLKYEEEIKKEIDRLDNKKMTNITDQIAFVELDTEMSLISAVTRMKSRRFPDKIIVTEQHRGMEASFYVRRKLVDIDLKCVVDHARKRGFNSGGKPEVAGVVLASEELESFREEVFPLLKDQLNHVNGE